MPRLGHCSSAASFATANPVYSEKKVSPSRTRVRGGNVLSGPKRAEQLAAALPSSGVQPGDRVGTSCGTTGAHGGLHRVPCMPVCITLNIRSSRKQLAFIINHAGDSGDHRPTVPWFRLAKIRDQIPSSANHRPRSGRSGLLGATIDYEPSSRRIARVPMPTLDPNDRPRSCVTPPGRPATPRASCIHTVRPGCTRWLTTPIPSDSASAIAVSDRSDVSRECLGRSLHGLLRCTELIMPQMFLQGEPIVKMIQELRPRSPSGPTIWTTSFAHGEQPDADLSSLRGIGPAAPRPTRHDRSLPHRWINVIQGWGMTRPAPWPRLDPSGGHSRGHRD